MKVYDQKTRIVYKYLITSKRIRSIVCFKINENDCKYGHKIAKKALFLDFDCNAFLDKWLKQCVKTINPRTTMTLPPLFQTTNNHGVGGYHPTFSNLKLHCQKRLIMAMVNYSIRIHQILANEVDAYILWIIFLFRTEEKMQ